VVASPTSGWAGSNDGERVRGGRRVGMGGHGWVGVGGRLASAWAHDRAWAGAYG
jgi:hypothetical protein